MKCKVTLRYVSLVTKSGRSVKQFVDFDSVIEASSLQEALPILLSQKGIKHEQVIRALVAKV